MMLRAQIHNKATKIITQFRYVSSHYAYKGNEILAIVREVYSPWERRAALTPVHVTDLVRQGIKVLVQPCNKRIFTNKEYEEAGAVITDDISSACLFIGVKQVSSFAEPRKCSSNQVLTPH